MAFIQTSRTRSLYGRYPTPPYVIAYDHPLMRATGSITTAEGLSQFYIFDARIESLDYIQNRSILKCPILQSAGSGVPDWKISGHGHPALGISTSTDTWNSGDGNLWGQTHAVMSLWWQGTDTNNEREVWGYRQGTSYFWMRFNADNLDRLEFFLRNSSGNFTWSVDNTGYLDGLPHHIAWSGGGGVNTARIYLDGLQVATSDITSMTGSFGGSGGLYSILEGLGAASDGDTSDVYWFLRCWENVELTDAEHWEMYDPDTRYDVLHELGRVVHFLPGVAPPVTAAKPPSGLSLMGVGTG